MPDDGSSIALMHNLATLNGYEQRLESFLELVEVQDDPELLAMKKMLEILVADTCELVSMRRTCVVYFLSFSLHDTQYTALYDEECSYYVLKKFKLQTDTSKASSTALETAQNILQDMTGSRSTQAYYSWIWNKLVCSLSDEELLLVNMSLSDTLHKGCCSE